MSELRRDVVTGRWVAITSAKGKNAEQFKCEFPYEKTPEDCPFCEGNESLAPNEIMAIRHEGTHPNGPGWRVRAIPNQFPALRIEQELIKRGSGIYDHISGFGAHEIIIDSPDHQKLVKDLTDEEMYQVTAVLQARVEDLYRDERIRSVMICKNEGLDAGARFTHPHHQIFATPIIPQSLREHLKGAENYFISKERCVYCDILFEEKSFGERVFFENDHFLGFCPYASRYPFEIWLMPKCHDANFFGSQQQSYSFAQAVRHTLTRLSLALGNPQFNYMIYTAPNPNKRRGSWMTLSEDFHWHMEIIPVLNKTQSFDRCTGFHLNPTPPEEAAKFLREIPVYI